MLQQCPPFPPLNFKITQSAIWQSGRNRSFFHFRYLAICRLHKVMFRLISEFEVSMDEVFLSFTLFAFLIMLKVKGQKG